MQAREIDLLVGTQMVTKGHDFPGVTLVGVLQPDQGMDLPDFRATERTFQLLEQVSGRAGRGDRPGRVIIQTYRPEHAAITAVVQHDYDGFVRNELDERRLTGYPPFTRMIALRLDARDPAQAKAGAAAAAAAAASAGGAAVRVQRPGRGASRPAARAGPLAGLAVVAGARPAGGGGARGRPHRQPTRGVMKARSGSATRSPPTQ